MFSISKAYILGWFQCSCNILSTDRIFYILPTVYIAFLQAGNFQKHMLRPHDCGEKIEENFEASHFEVLNIWTTLWDASKTLVIEYSSLKEKCLWKCSHVLLREAFKNENGKFAVRLTTPTQKYSSSFEHCPNSHWTAPPPALKRALCGTYFRAKSCKWQFVHGHFS